MISLPFIKPLAPCYGGGNPSPDLTLYDLVTIREGLWFWSSFRYMVSESHWEQSNMAMFSVPVWTLKKVELGLKPPTMRCKTMTIVGKWNSNYSIPVCFLFWSCPIPISPFRMIYLSLSPPKKDILFGKYNYKWTNMNIKTHTSLYIDHHRIPPLHRPPKKFPPVFFVLQKKRSLVASVPKISGGKVQRWSQASSTGRSVWCGAWLLCLMVSQEKRRGRSCFEGIFLVGKTRSFSGLFLFFFSLRRKSFFGRKSSWRKMFEVQSWNIYLSLGCTKYGEKTLPQKLGMKKNTQIWHSLHPKKRPGTLPWKCCPIRRDRNSWTNHA